MPEVIVPDDKADSMVVAYKRQGYRVVTTTDNKDGTRTVRADGRAVETR